MRQLTIREIDRRVTKVIAALPRRERVSRNEAARRLMKLGVKAVRNDKRIGQTLDRLIGTWTKAEASSLQASIRMCDQVDAELWR